MEPRTGRMWPLRGPRVDGVTENRCAFLPKTTNWKKHIKISKDIGYQIKKDSDAWEMKKIDEVSPPIALVNSQAAAHRAGQPRLNKAIFLH